MVFAGIAIGGTVALEALFAGPVSGASMNPARSLGPALLSLQLEHLWIYLIAPPLGAALPAAVVGSSTPIPQMEMLPGVTLYMVRQGKIDEGEFLPLVGN